eukprot:8152614-Ditylum_brightwellii.AAC.1
MAETQSSSSLPKIVITGGTGNLGSKLSKQLLSYDPPKYRVSLIEHPQFFNTSKVPPGAHVTKGDVGNIESGLSPDGGWVNSFDDADAVIHFSAVNPYPNATWDQSAESMDHCCNVFNAACSRGVRRVIFATTSHTMGGYKDVDPPLEAGTLGPDLPPKVGTKLLDPVALEASGDSVAYGAAKLCGERLAASLAALHAPRTTFVCLRVGWCQPGDNLPETLSAAGSPPEFQSDTGVSEEEKRGENGGTDELWFKGMWLSNRDFLAYFEAAL